MPSRVHEALIEMFRLRPSLAAELLVDVLGMKLPVHEQARVEPGGFSDLTPTEYRADAVVVLTAARVPVLAVVLEVQRDRDLDKRWSWPVYVTTLRARLRCPTVLMVVCIDAAIASWCSTPIELGNPGTRMVPLVLGPDRVPVVTDVEQASRVPELAVLSAVAHGSGPDRGKVFGALLGGLDTVDEERAKLYLDVVLDALPTAARSYLEALMAAGTYEYRSDFARRYVGQGRAEGEAIGEARAVLAVLDARGIAVPEDARSRITSCADLDQLDTWVRRAVTTSSVHELFAG